MATVASLVANPIVLRNPQPKFSSAKLSTTFNRRRHAASCAPKFKVDVKCFLSAAEKNQYLTTTTTDSQKSGRHGSVCNAIKDHLGFGKPLGRVGGTWSSTYPYDPKYPGDCPWTLALSYMLLSPLWAIPLSGQIWWPMYFKAFIMITLVALMAQHSWSYGVKSVVKLQVYTDLSSTILIVRNPLYIYIYIFDRVLMIELMISLRLVSRARGERSKWILIELLKLQILLPTRV